MLFAIQDLISRTPVLGTRSSNERGASLIEYALLIALIAAVCIAVVAFFGGSTSGTFSRVGTSVSVS